ncbi:MAG: phosphodiester glycosidase family protein [Bacteroidota bacterium]
MKDSRKNKKSIKIVDVNPYPKWTVLGKGVEYMEMIAPEKSSIGNSRLCVLRLDPEVLDFQLFNATRYNRTRLTAAEWADSFDLNIVINAGMYDMENGLIHRGYMKNGKHHNNPKFTPDYNSMIAFNPKDSSDSKFEIYDLTCDQWKTVKTKYRCYAQGMRMIDCNGEAMEWGKKQQSCSMLVAAKDEYGKIWLIFSRSPYSHNKMIEFMKGFKEDLRNAIYLEGGPETSLYVDFKDHCIERIGSYVSDTYPTDSNPDFWKLPNVIGIKIQK